MYSTGSPHRFSTTALAIDEFAIDYQNRLVELEDLLYNEEQTGLLIDERASAVYTPGEPSLVDADRMMWDYNPIMTSRFVNPSKSGTGRYYRATPSRDFAGMIQKMKDYVPHRIAFAKNRFINEGLMPKAPTVEYLGQDGYGVDDLRFSSTAFKGGSIFAPQEFGAMTWRLAEVTDVTAEGFSPEPPNQYEIDTVWESEILTEFTPEITLPTAEIRPGRVYRVRARMMNTGGYWSHWSGPVQFMAGSPNIQTYLDGLVISEILFAPAEATEAELQAGFATEDFEFIELLNLGDTALDLAPVRFTKGIDFDFTEASVKQLEPGQRLLLVRNRAAFESRYGPSGAVIIGGYGDGEANKLDNSGERLKLSFGAGIAIRDLTYEPGEGWPDPEDGFSLTLVDTTQPTDHAAAGSWGIGSVFGGTPGSADDGVVVVVDPEPGQSGFLEWQTARFDEDQRADPLISGILADPDRDGWVNLQEYAFLGEPLAPDGPLATVQAGPNGGLEWRFTRPKAIPDVDFALQISDDLEKWVPLPAAPATVESDGDRETVIHALDRQSARFWRILTTLKN